MERSGKPARSLLQIPPAREGKARFLFFFFLKVKFRGTEIITGSPLLINSRVQDLDSQKVCLQCQWKGLFFEGRPVLENGSPCSPPGAATDPVICGTDISLLGERFGGDSQSAYPGHVLPCWEVPAALGRGFGESLLTREKVPSPICAVTTSTASGRGRGRDPGPH